MPNGPEFIEIKPGFKPGKEPKKEERVAPVELIDPIGKHLKDRKEAKISALREIPIPPELFKGREEVIRSIEEASKDPAEQSKELNLPSPEQIKLGEQFNKLGSIESELKGKLTPDAKKFFEDSKLFLRKKIDSIEKERQEFARKFIERKEK